MEIRNILEIFWRRRWIIINVFTAIFLIIFIGTLIVTPWYDATSKVLLKKSPSVNSVQASLGFQSGSGADAAFTDADRADYLALSTVRPIIDKVILDVQVFLKYCNFNWLKFNKKASFSGFKKLTC